MTLKVLTSDQIDQFIECGHTKVSEAFAVADALAVQDFLWKQVELRGVQRNDQSTWTQPKIQISERYNDPVFQPCMTERLCDAVEDLVGPGRWRNRGNRTEPWGWWPVNFSIGANKPWDVPTNGWHWDGIHFRHFVNSPDQGLLLLCAFSETRPHGGATLVAEGSHQIVARFLNQHPEGVKLEDGLKEVKAAHPWLAELNGLQTSGSANLNRIQHFMNETTTDADGTRLRVVETTANPGDIYLCHPFLFHTASSNHSGQPRFMCNKTTPLTGPMQFDRADGDYSAVEISIRRALGRGQTSASTNAAIA